MPLPVMAGFNGVARKALGARNTPRTGQRVGTSTINNNEEGYTRDVSDAELVDSNLSRYLDKSNNYIQGARGRGTAAANSRGLGNSTLAAAAGEAAAIDAAGAFATQDAQAAQRAASESLSSLSGQRQSDEGNQTSAFNTMYGADTSAAIAMGDRESRERENSLERDYGRETATRDRGWNVEDRDYDTGRQDRWRTEDREWNEMTQQRRNREGLSVAIIQNAMNNPEYWRDPNAVAGAVDYYTSEWDRWYPPSSGGTGDGLTQPRGP